MNTIGKYKILAELGRGGMGVVYKALDPDINREVAIKTIPYGLIVEDDKKERLMKQFTVEAQAAGRLNHPNIVTIHDVGREGELAYIVMQYIEGRSLKQVIDAGEPLTLDQIMAVSISVCKALDYAHSHGIVHRDIKPANILIGKTGQPFIVDFGVAKLESTTLTATGVAVGTPSYMSPEQISGKKVDKRSDVFSLGAVLYELFEGRGPFAADTVTTAIHKVLDEEPPPLKKMKKILPEGLEAVVRKALAKAPHDRYQSCAELAADLKKYYSSPEDTLYVDTAGKIPASAALKSTGASWLKSKPVRLGLLAVLVAAAGFSLWKFVLAPKKQYGNFIAIVPFHYSSPDTPPNFIESILQRTLSASTALPVFSRDEMSFYQKKTANTTEKNIEPVLSLGGEFASRMTGFDLTLSLIHQGRETVTTFSSKGTNDLISRTMDEVNAFIAKKTGGLAGTIAGGRTFAQVLTANSDALVHFFKGDQAWAKLESEAAHAEFKTAVETDPAFSLARLKLAEVQIFRGDRTEARAELKAASENKDRLISYDLLRLNALLARLDSKPSEEREYLRQLVEAFPLNREYHYEFAESYFHAGDGTEAAKDYLKALDIDPSYALAHNHLAFCYSWTGDHAKAEEHFRRYVELDNTANSYDSLASGNMFAGRYDQAVEACERGLTLDPKLYYLHSTKATNLMLQGRLSLAEDSLAQEVGSDPRESTKLGARFNSAYIAFLRGDWRGADNALISLRQAYSAPAYSDQVDDTSNLPFWLTGVIAARQKNAPRLREMIAVLDAKIAAKAVNVTNYSPILKFALHLKALQAALDKNAEEASRLVEEGERLKHKMGYWSSAFNLSFFLDEFAVTLMNLGQTAKARDLLDQVLAYNGSCAPARVHLAALLEAAKDLNAAKAEAGKARTLLAGADPDYGLLRELDTLERRLK